MTTMTIVKETENVFNEKQLAIFRKITDFNWANSAFAIKSTLNLMALTYIRSERIEQTNCDDRSVVAFHLEVLQYLIDDLRRCELNIPNIEDKKTFFNKKIGGFNTLWDEPDFAYEVKDSLLGLSQDYIRSEEVEGIPLEDRQTISFHLHLLNTLVSDIYDLVFNAK